METVPKNSRKGAKTSGVTTRTVSSSTFETENVLPLIENTSELKVRNSGLSITWFHVNTTSSAVSFAPSLQRTPFRKWNVQVLLSGSTLHDSARPGPGSC